MSASKPAVVDRADLEAAALETARVLGRAIGESSVFRAFEGAQETLVADEEVSRRLRAYQTRQQEIWLARSWGGADPLQEQALDEEWRTLSAMPTLRAYLRAQEELTALLREVAGIISQEIGIDYGATCAPASGCCCC